MKSQALIMGAAASVEPSRCGRSGRPVFSTANYTLSANIVTLSLAIGNAVYGTGNDDSNTI
jgi:hypothetical protein